VRVYVHVIIIRYAKRMRRIILLSLACIAVTNFSTLSHKRHDFWKNYWNKICFECTILSEIFLIARRIQWDIITNTYKSSCKVPDILVSFKEIWMFWTDFQKSSTIKYYENLSSGSWVVPRWQRDRRTDGRPVGRTWLS
jgi:hypothetical protein